MRKIALLLCLCMFSVASFTGKPQKEEQQPPQQEQFDLLASAFDYGPLRSRAEQDSVYLPLVERFVARDSTLTLDDLSLLYYGFAFRPGYQGSMDGVSSPVAQLIKKGEYREAWDQGVAYLKDNPVSLPTLEGMTMAAFKLDLPREEYAPYTRRAIDLFRVIKNSGDGVSAETAYRVISVADEYVYMRIMKKLYKFKSQSLVDSKYGPCDEMIMLNEDGSESSPIYFNVWLPMLHMSKLFEK